MLRAPRHRRLQFSLRAALIAVTVCGVGLAALEKVERQRRAVAALRQLNPAATVCYQDQLPVQQKSPSLIVTRVRKWFRDTLGEDYVARVAAVEMFYATDADLACVARIGSIERLDLPRAIDVTDAGLADIAKLTRLRTLSLEDADRITDVGLGHLERLANLRRLVLDVRADRVTPAAIERLGRALPRCRILLRGAIGREQIAATRAPRFGRSDEGLARRLACG